MSRSSPTRDRILDVAQRLTQERGFNAFSYLDIGTQLGIRNASIHYHFPSKAELGLALVRRYREWLQDILTELDAEPSPRRRLDRYVDSYREVVHDDGRICLCTVLTAEDAALPAGMREEIQAFFDLNERWLGGVLQAGIAAGELRVTGARELAAASLLATLEGAMLLARAARDASRFTQLARAAVADLYA
ncbi:TetR/AcrR family transcriptional regulator [uncultured Deinococcus sp.]|uniref:TetR/AcrR family transcriptional regulator n=1 Tax=uncultured Deinococcus sp. TaxID=158789 RepID=UPI0025FDCE41|nr:TetR/AcrR family transcriptional regulator [uncultured Deinococcus sp.]